MADDANDIGGMNVGVGIDLTKLDEGLAQAKRDTADAGAAISNSLRDATAGSFDGIVAGMAAVSSAAESLGDKLASAVSNVNTADLTASFEAAAAQLQKVADESATAYQSVSQSATASAEQVTSAWIAMEEARQQASIAAGASISASEQTVLETTKAYYAEMQVAAVAAADAVKEAFSTLGVTSTASLQETSSAYSAAYAKIEADSKSTAQDIKASWIEMEQARQAAAMSAGQQISNEEFKELETAKAIYAQMQAAAQSTAQQVQQAFSTLGVTSAAELKKTSDEYRAAYDLIRSSSESTARDIQASWIAMEEARQAAAVAAGQAISSVDRQTLENAKASYDEILKTATERLQEFGSSLTTIGASLTAVVTVPLYELATAAAMVADSFQEAFARIEAGTGAVGNQLEGLKGSFTKVLGEVPQSVNDVATAITSLKQRLDLTGPALEDMSKRFLDLTRVAGGDLSTNIRSVTRVFEQFKVDAQDQAKVMDYLVGVWQHTGIEVSKLATQLTQQGFASIFKELGIDLEHAAAMLGQFEKMGVPVTQMLSAMRIEIGKMTKAGIEDPAAAMQILISQIKELGPASDLAYRMFGRNAQAATDAIKSGAFENDAFVASIKSSIVPLEQLAAHTLTTAQQFDILKNRMEIALQPLGAALLKVAQDLLPTLKTIIEIVSNVTEAFASLDPSVQLAIIAFAAMAASAGPLLVGAGLVAQGITGLIEAFGALSLAAGGTGLTGILSGLAGASLPAVAIAVGGIVTAWQLWNVKDKVSDIAQLVEQNSKFASEHGLTSWTQEATSNLKELGKAVLDSTEGLRLIRDAYEVISKNIARASDSLGGWKKVLTENFGQLGLFIGYLDSLANAMRTISGIAPVMEKAEQDNIITLEHVRLAAGEAAGWLKKSTDAKITDTDATKKSTEADKAKLLALEAGNKAAKEYAQALHTLHINEKSELENIAKAYELVQHSAKASYQTRLEAADAYHAAVIKAEKIEGVDVTSAQIEQIVKEDQALAALGKTSQHVTDVTKDLSVSMSLLGIKPKDDIAKLDIAFQKMQQDLLELGKKGQDAFVPWLQGLNALAVAKVNLAEKTGGFVRQEDLDTIKETADQLHALSAAAQSDVESAKQLEAAYHTLGYQAKNDLGQVAEAMAKITADFNKSSPSDQIKNTEKYLLAIDQGLAKMVATKAALQQFIPPELIAQINAVAAGLQNFGDKSAAVAAINKLVNDNLKGLGVTLKDDLGPAFVKYYQIVQATGEESIASLQAENAALTKLQEDVKKGLVSISKEGLELLNTELARTDKALHDVGETSAHVAEQTKAVKAAMSELGLSAKNDGRSLVQAWKDIKDEYATAVNVFGDGSKQASQAMLDMERAEESLLLKLSAIPNGLALIGKSTVEAKARLAELSAAITAAGDTSLALVENQKKTAAALHELGISEKNDIDALGKAYQQVANDAEKSNKVKLEAELKYLTELVNAEQTASKGVSEYQKDRIKEVRAELRDMGVETSQRFKDVAKEVANIFDTLTKGFADAILSGKNFGDVMLNTLKKIGEAIVQFIIKQLLATNDQLLAIEKSITKVLGDLFGGGRSGTKSVGVPASAASALGQGGGSETSVGGSALPTEGRPGDFAGEYSGGGGGGDELGGGGGLSGGALGLIDLAITAINDIVQGALLAHISNKMGEVEINTRSTYFQLIGLQEQANAYWPYLKGIQDYLTGFQAPYIVGIEDDLQHIAQSLTQVVASLAIVATLMAAGAGVGSGGTADASTIQQLLDLFHSMSINDSINGSLSLRQSAILQYAYANAASSAHMSSTLDDISASSNEIVHHTNDTADEVSKIVAPVAITAEATVATVDTLVSGALRVNTGLPDSTATRGNLRNKTAPGEPSPITGFADPFTFPSLMNIEAEYVRLANTIADEMRELMHGTGAGPTKEQNARLDELIGILKAFGIDANNLTKAIYSYDSTPAPLPFNGGAPADPGKQGSYTSSQGINVHVYVDLTKPVLAPFQAQIDTLGTAVAAAASGMKQISLAAKDASVDFAVSSAISTATARHSSAFKSTALDFDALLDKLHQGKGNLTVNVTAPTGNGTDIADEVVKALQLKGWTF